MTTHRFHLAALLFCLCLVAPASAGQYKERERQYDVLHYAIDITVDEKSRSVSGSVTMRIVPLAPLSSCDIDAAEMTISSVELVRTAPAALRFTHASPVLRVMFPAATTAGDTLDIRITYSCRPRNGLYFIAPDTAYPDKPWQVWSQGQPEENRYWLPCYDYPNDFATMEMRATVNERFIAISNGALLDVSPGPAPGTKTFYWYSAKPFVSYLIALIVGEYAVIEEKFRHIPVLYYVYEHQKPDAIRSFGRTVDMLTLYSDRLRYEYPWPKYGQVVIADFMYGGMENTSITTLFDETIHSERAHVDYSSDNLVAHEIVHQWFGNLLTCRNWSHAWLNEGFATYFQGLYNEERKGWDEFQYEMYSHHKAITEADTGIARRATVTNEYVHPTDIFDNRIYGRGASILHMLRFLIGDDMFWRSMQRYVAYYQYQNVVTDDLRRIVEETTKQDVRWFFDQWLPMAGYPIFDVTSTYDAHANLARLTIQQRQVVDSLTPFYRMPVDVELATKHGTTVHRVMVEPLREQVITIASHEEPLNITFDKGGWILKKLSHTKPVTQWLHQLKHGDGLDRVLALEALHASIDAPEVRAEVAHLLIADSLWSVRKHAAEALGKATDPTVLALLAPAFSDAEAKVRVEATKSLGNFRTLDALVALGNILAADSSYAVAAEAVTSLVKIDSVNAWTYFEKGMALDSRMEVIRSAAVKGLGNLRSERARTRLLELTAYGKPVQVRVAAVEALGTNWKTDAGVRRALENLLGDRSHPVRRKAIEMLGAMARPQSRARLVRLLGEEVDPVLCREARKAILLIERASAPRGSQ
jgi:aminopeptidase N